MAPTGGVSNHGGGDTIWHLLAGILTTLQIPKQTFGLMVFKRQLTITLLITRVYKPGKMSFAIVVAVVIVNTRNLKLQKLFYTIAYFLRMSVVPLRPTFHKNMT